MGGSIGFTIRTADGKEYRQCRWTNIMPAFFHCVEFLREDPEFIKEFVKNGEDLRKAYMARDFEEAPMAKVYGPNMRLAPVAYGLIVVDLKTKTILSQQDYCDIGAHWCSAPATLHRHRQQDQYERVKKLFEAGKIQRACDYPPYAVEDYKEYDVSSWEAFSKVEDFVGYLKVDVTPFDVKNFQTYDKEQGELMKQTILDLGFTLTKREERVWSEYF